MRESKISEDVLQDKRFRRHGFTLVELLVVIGIIALLISMLLPALKKAREHAMVVTCLSNERQMMLATLLYVHDNKGFFPSVRVVIDPTAPRWAGMIKPYMKNDDIFFCPVELSGGRQNNYIANGAFWMFYFHGAYGGQEKPTKITDIRKPSQLAVFWESVLEQVYTEPDPLVSSSQPGFYYSPSIPYMAGRHFFGVNKVNGREYGSDNIMFADGHGGTFDMKEYVRHGAGWMYNYPYHPDNAFLGLPPPKDGPPGPLGEFWTVPTWK